MRDRLAAFFEGKVGLHGGHMSAVLPVDGAVDHAAHFAEPELSDLTPLLAPTGRPMRFRIFERDFQLFFHMPSNLRGWVGHMLSKGSPFLGRFNRQKAGGGSPELQPIDRSKPFDGGCCSGSGEPRSEIFTFHRPCGGSFSCLKLLIELLWSE